MEAMGNQEASGERAAILRERQLIAGARRGCAQSAHALVVAYQDRLGAFVWRLVRDRHDVEEICQDTFLRAFQALDSFDSSYRFSTWLFTIAYRLCLNRLRRRKDYSGDVDFDLLAPRRVDGRGDGGCPVGEQVANSEEARRLKKIVWDSVDQLTPAQRATVLLFYRESLSCQEIGEILEIPAATVKSHLHRARKRLEVLLGEHMAADWSVIREARAGGAA